MKAAEECGRKWHIDTASAIRVILIMYFNGELIPIPRAPPTKKQVELSKQAALIRDWEEKRA